jgi:hypothetical protein
MLCNEILPNGLLLGSRHLGDYDRLAARTGATGNAKRGLVEKSQGKRPLGR